MNDLDSSPRAAHQRLTDRYGRHVTYLRLSVTDRCDFRCTYCMDTDAKFAARSEVLTLEELHAVARAFVDLGATKIRLTGGEPLLRKNILWLTHKIGCLDGLDELALTTNGSQLERLADGLRATGVRRLNISLDSLDAERFRRITRVGDLVKVMRGIDAAQAAGFERIKLNTVVLKHRNHDEVVALTRFAINRGLDISFIEEMPLGIVGDHDRGELYYSSDRIKADLEQQFTLVPTTENTGGPSRYYRVAGHATRVGFISPHSHNFCESCNRVRVTTEGRLLLCLGQEHSVDLRALLREKNADASALQCAIVDAMAIKPKGHDFDLGRAPIILRHMNATGG